MARSNKPHGPQQDKTGNDFINTARSLGAVVSNKPDKNGFYKVSTRKGSTYIAPGDQPLDTGTRKNLRRWFRLLGLLLIFLMVIGVVDYFWGVWALPPLF